MPSSTEDPRTKVTTYTYPSTLKFITIALTQPVVILSSSRSFIEPGSFLYESVLARRNTATKYSTTVQDVVFYTFVVTHGCMAVWFAGTKLQGSGVKFLSADWFKWVMTVVLGGLVGVQHWEEVVAKEKSTAPVKK